MRKNTPSTTTLMSASFALLLQGCSMFTQPAADSLEDSASYSSKLEVASALPPLKTTSVQVEPMASKKDSDLVDVEVLIPVQDEEPEGYLINYGFAPADLSLTETVSVRDLEIRSDPDFGLVHRYILHDIPKGKKVYVSLSTMRAGEILEPSQAKQAKELK